MSQSIVTIGTFDGVHRGHQALLREVRSRAETAAMPAIAYTFGLPPRTSSQRVPSRTLLLPEALKHRLLLRYVGSIEPASFDLIARMSPRQFVTQVLLEALRMRTLVVGEGFRFGQDRAGSTDTLAELSARLGFEFVVIPTHLADGDVVSSTRIRDLVAEGRVEDAARLLGRPHLVFGRVESGDRIGTTLGYPTANLCLDRSVLAPKAGIYFVHAFFAGRRGHGLLYVGTRPTLGGEDLRCEVHLLRSPEDELRGLHLEVHVLQRLRDDRQFPSLSALQRQIACDVEEATRMAISHPVTGSPISG